jgi:hypothetical protein
MVLRDQPVFQNVGRTSSATAFMFVDVRRTAFTEVFAPVAMPQRIPHCISPVQVHARSESDATHVMRLFTDAEIRPRVDVSVEDD